MLWHPFAPMGEVRDAEFVIDRGEDVWIWDAAGTRYLDATASLWYANVGHGRGEIAEAVERQMRRLEAYGIFGDFANAPALELAERLAALAPLRDARVFLTSGGGDSVDSAVKIARRHAVLIGQSQRTHLLSRRNAYHGTHGFGTSIGGIDANTTGYGASLGGATIVEHDSVDAMRAAAERIGPERIAAVFAEPVIGAGGVLPPPPGYLEGLSELCDEIGALLVIDAVICGFGRLGTWYGIERWPAVEPDMIVFAKGVTSGYLPLGGVVASGRVAAPFFARGAPPLRHGQTYAGHPTCCAAALANLDLLAADRLLERGRELEGDLRGALAPLLADELVEDVRGGIGLMAAVELHPRTLAAVPRAVSLAAAGARRAGVLVRPLGSALAVSPPLTAEREHFAMIRDAIAVGLDDVRAEAAARVAA
jgi:adenosylmethionine-8-amino-7-oxononanoate aminotransferase